MKSEGRLLTGNQCAIPFEHHLDFLKAQKHRAVIIKNGYRFRIIETDA
jgi:hypothetical protein